MPRTGMTRSISLPVVRSKGNINAKVSASITRPAVEIIIALSCRTVMTRVSALKESAGVFGGRGRGGRVQASEAIVSKSSRL